MAAVAELAKRARLTVPEARPQPSAPQRITRKRTSPSTPRPDAGEMLHELRKLLVGHDEFVRRTVAAEVARSADVKVLKQNIQAELVSGKLTGELVDQITEKVLERIVKDDKFIEKAASLAYRAMLEGTVQ